MYIICDTLLCIGHWLKITDLRVASDLHHAAIDCSLSSLLWTGWALQNSRWYSKDIAGVQVYCWPTTNATNDLLVRFWCSCCCWSQDTDGLLTPKAAAWLLPSISSSTVFIYCQEEHPLEKVSVAHLAGCLLTPHLSIAIGGNGSDPWRQKATYREHLAEGTFKPEASSGSVGEWGTLELYSADATFHEQRVASQLKVLDPMQASSVSNASLLQKTQK